MGIIFRDTYSSIRDIVSYGLEQNLYTEGKYYPSIWKDNIFFEK